MKSGAEKKEKSKMYKDGYYVIGGHYSPFCYGHTKTLHAAKLLATKDSEYWDDLQGWNTPSISVS